MHTEVVGDKLAFFLRDVVLLMWHREMSGECSDGR